MPPLVLPDFSDRVPQGSDRSGEISLRIVVSKTRSQYPIFQNYHPAQFAMIRPIAPDDTTALIALAEATGLFGPHETEELALMLAEHFGGETNSQDIWITDDDGGLLGVAYVAPERMTDGTL